MVTAASNSKTKYLSAICPDLVTNAVRTVIGEQLVLVRSWQTEAETLWNQNVLPSVGPMLRDAITYTAQFLVAWTTVAETGAETLFLTCLDSGEVIDVPHGFLLGAAVQQYAFNGGTNQQWMAVPLTGADAGYFRITSRLSIGPSPWVLDVAHQSLQAGAPVIVYPWNDQDNQKLEASGGRRRHRLGVKAIRVLPHRGQPIQRGFRPGDPAPGRGCGSTWPLDPVGVDTLGCAAGPLVADVPTAQEPQTRNSSCSRPTAAPTSSSSSSHWKRIRPTKTTRCSPCSSRAAALPSTSQVRTRWCSSRGAGHRARTGVGSLSSSAATRSSTSRIVRSQGGS